MGQKTSPTGFRLALTKKWKSLWYANKQEFGGNIGEDRFIRNFLMSKPCCSGTAQLTIKRMSGKIEVTIHTARPGLVIGRNHAANNEVALFVEELHHSLLDSH